MSAIPPIEPMRPANRVLPVRRRRREEDDERERRFDGALDEEEGGDEDGEGDDRPHVDVRA